jgi:hypothetical protein
MGWVACSGVNGDSGTGWVACSLIKKDPKFFKWHKLNLGYAVNILCKALLYCTHRLCSRLLGVRRTNMLLHAVRLHFLMCTCACESWLAAE